MMAESVLKPSFDEWRFWLDILAKRYRYAAEIHRKNDRPAEADELSETARLAKDLFLEAHAARTASPPPAADDLALMMDDAIRTACALTQKAIAEMPIIARNMQDFLGAVWKDVSWDKGGNPQILEFFVGGRSYPAHGIRSGFQGDGGLPAELARLVAAEAVGGDAQRAAKYIPAGELEGTTRGSGASLRQKAPFNDWWYWSDVLAKRLKLASDIYRENDEQARSVEVGETAKKLQDLFLGPARMGQKGAKTPDEKATLVAAEESAILEAVTMWREILTGLPFISTQMQDFLRVVWQDISWEKSSPPKAVELFWGPKGRNDEGIRSGVPTDGGLPGIMMNYLMAERGSSNRAPTQYKTEAAHNNYWGRSPSGGGM